MERDSAQEQYDKMTKTPVHQLVLRLGLPTTVSMLVTSIYNMADTFFVSQLGTSVSGATVPAPRGAAPARYSLRCAISAFNGGGTCRRLG